MFLIQEQFFLICFVHVFLINHDSVSFGAFDSWKKWSGAQKNNKWPVHSAKTSDQPGHPPSLISLCCPSEEGFGSLVTHEAHSEDSDLTRADAQADLSWVHRSFCFLVLISYQYLSCNMTKLTDDCAPSKDSDQPWHPPSPISLRCPLNG